MSVEKVGDVEMSDPPSEQGITIEDVAGHRDDGV